MRYILYARKSSESEDRQVQSIDDQLRVLREFATRVNLNIALELTESRSAKNPNARPQFAEMLARIERGEADAILCWSINRLARNPIDSGQLSWLLQRGVLKSIRTPDREYLPEDNVLLMAVESGVANQYILDLRKAVIRGMEGRASRGWIPSKPPLGYRVNPETKEVEPKQPEFRMLRRAWDLLLLGSYTVPQILEELKCRNPNGARSKSKPFLSRSHLYRTFDHPFYCGHFFFRGQRYEGNHQPMVSADEFERAQRILHKDTRVQPQKHEFPFTGLMRCGRCGCQITAERKVKRYRATNRVVSYEYYHCTHRRGNCREGSVTGSHVEAQIVEALSRIQIDVGFGHWLMQVLTRDWDEDSGLLQVDIADQVRKIELAERRLERLIEIRLSGELSAHEFVSLKQQTESALVACRQKVIQLKRNTAIGRQALINAVRFSLQATRAFASTSKVLKRWVARHLASKYVLTLGELQISLHPIFTKLTTLEPLIHYHDMVLSGAVMDPNPAWRSQRDAIRNLIAGMSDEERSFADATILTDEEIEDASRE